MKQKIKIERIGYDLQEWPIIEKIAYEFAEILSVPLIIIQNTHGANYKDKKKVYKGKKLLRIYFWSAFLDTGTRMYDKKMFGKYPTSNGAYSRYQSENPNITHLYSPEGVVVAEYHKKYPNTLYILFDLPDQHPEEVKAHFRGILHEYMNMRYPNKNFLYTLKRQYEKCADAVRTSQYEIEKTRSKRFSYQLETVKKQNEIRFKASLLKEKRQRCVNEFLAIERACDSLSMKGDALHVKSEDIEVVFYIDSPPDYALWIGEEHIPFTVICGGPAKSGLACYMGSYQFFSAYTMIKRWAAAYKKKHNNIIRHEKEEAL